MTPDGRTVLAPVPEGIDGHFGPELHRFVLMQYYQRQSTLPRLSTFLRSVGVAISKRQLQRLLSDKAQSFIVEAQDVLRAGRQTAPYVSVDDTAARHAGKNGYCTQIGNEWFTWFATRSVQHRPTRAGLGEAWQGSGDAEHRWKAGGGACRTAGAQAGYLDAAAA